MFEESDRPMSIDVYSNRFMNNQPITAERLLNYRYIVREYLQLLEDKKSIISKIGTLKGINYDKIKVQSGNTHKTSEEEHYAITLERINKAIWAYQGWLPDEQKAIKTHLYRLKNPVHIEILLAYYINGKKWSVILNEKLGTRTDFKDNYANYWKTLMDWRKSALEQLEKISSQPYVPTDEEQLHLQLQN